jgi:hypothetical protein
MLEENPIASLLRRQRAADRRDRVIADASEQIKRVDELLKQFERNRTTRTSAQRATDREGG